MFEFIDEINNFISKLSDLIKDDWNKTKHFIKTYKTHILWVIILLSFIEYVGIMNLSSIVGQPYKNNNKQHGGAPFIANYTLDKSVSNMTTNYNKKTNNIAQNIARESAETQEERIKKNNVSPDNDIPSTPEATTTAATTEATTAAATTDTASPATDTKPPATGTSKAPAKPKSKGNGLFNKFASLLKTGSSGKSPSNKGKNNKERSKLGPVFGNLNMIMDYLKKIGSVLSVILVCLGVISLPVLIFLTIVYTVIKYLIKKVLVL